MGVISSIIRSGDDLAKPQEKSYWGYKFSVEIINKEKVTNKKLLLPSDKKAMQHELSDLEPVSDVIVLKNSNNKLGRFTTSQIKEIFDDMGFNVEVLVGEEHFSDVDAVMNINGSSIPGWVYIARYISKYFPSKEKLLLSKLSVGKDRLHVRIFEENDGSWLIVGHTEHNWLSLNLKKVYESHLRTGAGDYITGTIMVYELLREFAKTVGDNKIFKQKDIDQIIKNAYKKSLLEKLKKGKSS